MGIIGVTIWLIGVIRELIDILELIGRHIFV